MSMTTPGNTKVAIIPFQTRDDASPNPFHPSGLPPRSRLYGLVPCALHTIFQESLTSYLNRLGWRHHVSPRDLVAQEIVPSLSYAYPKRLLATFSRGSGMQMNGSGSIAQEWSSELSRLTKRSDIHMLTLDSW